MSTKEQRSEQIYCRNFLRYHVKKFNICPETPSIKQHWSEYEKFLLQEIMFTRPFAKSSTSDSWTSTNFSLSAYSFDVGSKTFVLFFEFSEDSKMMKRPPPSKCCFFQLKRVIEKRANFIIYNFFRKQST